MSGEERDSGENQAQSLDIWAIRLDGGTQMRAAFNEATVAEYAERLDAGDEFPPVVVFRDADGALWLADGFHRVEAARQVNRETISAEVRDGARRDAVLYAVGANTRHGLRPTNADKRRSVTALLNDDEWQQWSDREIARVAGVSQPFVSKLRAELSDNGFQMTTRMVQRGGTTYTMDTESIGRTGDDWRDWGSIRQRMHAAETVIGGFLDQGCPAEQQQAFLQAWDEIRREGVRQGDEMAILFSRSCTQILKAAVRGEADEATRAAVEDFKGWSLFLHILLRFRDGQRAQLKEGGHPPGLLPNTWFADIPVSMAALDVMELQYQGLPAPIRHHVEDEEWPYVASAA